MSSDAYKPNPLDTDGIVLPVHLEGLIETLARHTHDVWAERRMSEGWTYGPARDDETHQHPNLLPFDDLPEDERQGIVERIRRALQAIMKLGYDVKPPAVDVGGSPEELAARSRIADLTRTLDARQVPIRELYERLYREDEPTFWQLGVEFHRALARGLISSGHATASYDYATKALSYVPDDLPLRYLQALALARGRNVTRARNAVEELLQMLEEHPDSHANLLADTQALAGRLFKDMAGRARSEAQRRKYLQSSRERYEQAYRLTSSYFPGINAATMARLADDDPRRARQLADAVNGQANLQLADPKSRDDYWLLATLGEANLILEKFDLARRYYQRAVDLAQQRIGDITSMRRNVELLKQVVKVPDELLAVFNYGGVVVFSGHMLDHPHRTTKLGMAARFPPDPVLERAVSDEIGREIDLINPAIGYSSCANGSDILFCEQMLKRGKELNVVLPFDLDDFYLTSVDLGVPQRRRWRERCDAILEHASVHFATRERYLGDPILFEFTNRIMQGLAILRARELGVKLDHLCVLDMHQLGNLTGGAGQALRKWERAGMGTPRVVDLAQIREDAGASSFREVDPGVMPEIEISEYRRKIRYMLFSDVKNFSKLSEEQSPAFFVKFLQQVESILVGHRVKPDFSNTWGDAVFMVFESPVTCADYAMQLIHRIEEVNWTKYGLPEDTTLRIGVHAGPVYSRMNHIVGREDFIGSHVNRAARIEPVATPGCAFVSEHFAAELAVNPDHDFICEYIGIQELAKRFGKAELFRLDRR
ncbi:MAG: DUF4071 domain-containing protein [Phycisphaera sp.]|nr:DUF4071 domain-containing protein [Phycisphaera sp.]